MRVYRLHRVHRSASDYGGALLYPGRWHPRGTPILYFSLALSLACLEQLVHLAPNELPEDYAFTSVEVNVEPEVADYPGDLADVDGTRRYGHRWSTDREALAALVPSIIIPVEFNLLVNPLHAELASLVWSHAQPFAFDPRLLHKSIASRTP
jgi:RES domain-containing protein